MRQDFVIIVKPEFYLCNGEEDRERMCTDLAKTIECIRGVESASIDWKGEQEDSK